ncbi:cell division protein ZapE [Deinococcus peraridilitoris]|uniref:Putative ATPase n=1 Tax=Deinococcus peraridilitoris (strain DSM 19664 / LMG 22246 / CIP 109416 / KR-200) TaxID=937777 RepID=L0A3G9_DEIPD|nr:cell division protein ZapE [Deinococcus peraridilitoris]AFZ68391.1 putative ATPase [Deinococcus peraridilitoris DSM 19664]
MTTVDLTQRFPTLTPHEMLAGFVPSRRFEEARFDNYLPNPAFESQARAREELQNFAEAVGRTRGGFRLLRRAPSPGEGIYLDGGFGVGKTHLLAATFFTVRSEQKAFLSFQELLYVIGALGMTEAVKAFTPFRFLAIDEFELDDPGNTHMVNTFLSQLMPGGTSVVTTSNTEPGALGQGRFNTHDFERQIAAIAGRFRSLRVDGPDFRARGAQVVAPLGEAEYRAWSGMQGQARFAPLEHRALNRHLLEVHPARFRKLLSGVDAVGVLDASGMPDQNVALRFVHFIDKVYDLGVGLALSGVPLGSLFPETYRHGAYAKKYSRCLSRLSELLSEARSSVAVVTPSSV